MKKLRSMKNMLFFVFLLVVLVPALAFAEEVVLVVNGSVPDQALTKDEVKAIFLGEKTKWSDNSRITFVVLKVPEVMDTFMREFVGKSSFQFDNYWKYQTFTGKGSPPRSFDDVDALIDFVSKTPGAVGFVPRDTPLNSSKAISVQ